MNHNRLKMLLPFLEERAERFAEEEKLKLRERMEKREVARSLIHLPINVQKMTEVFKISSASPTGLIWKKRPIHHFTSKRSMMSWNAKHSGKTAGFKASIGNADRHRVHVDGRAFLVSRIVFAIHNGIDPGMNEVDHIDRNTLNNSVDNLRLVTRSINARNKGKKKNKKTDIGVFVNKRGDYQSHIGIGNKHFYLGTFDSESAALSVKKIAEEIVSLKLHEIHKLPFTP